MNHACSLRGHIPFSASKNQSFLLHISKEHFRNVNPKPLEEIEEITALCIACRFRVR